jgi:folate-binding protein YgfZ
MEKDQIIILEDRGLISVTGDDAKEFLQNIITNNIEKVDRNNSIYTALLSPQGKYLHEFFIIYVDDGYLIDCDNKSSEDLISILSKYRLRSKVNLINLSSDYVVGVLNLSKFNEIQSEANRSSNTIIYRESPLFIDPRKKELGARIISSLEKLHLTVKKLNLKIIDSSKYFNLAHHLGIPEKDSVNLKEKLFGLEANFEELNAIDFKKGCYVGQENTARMKLKNKLRRRLLALKTNKEVEIGDDLNFGEIKIGKILIGNPYPFALVKLYDPDLSDFKDKELNCRNAKVKIINSY